MDPAFLVGLEEPHGQLFHAWGRLRDLVGTRLERALEGYPRLVEGGEGLREVLSRSNGRIHHILEERAASLALDPRAQRLARFCLGMVRGLRKFVV